MNSQSQQVPSLRIHGHLQQLYPCLPKYCNDPQQSPIIQVYDLLLKRYRGMYNQEPKYFSRSPIICPVLGTMIPGVGMDIAYFSAMQNVIVCIGFSQGKQIRVCHYQAALYGEKKLDLQSTAWKYQDKNDQYTNILIATFKVFSVHYNLHTMPSMNLLIYDDYIHDQYIYGKQALSMALFSALQSMLLPKQSFSSMTPQLYHKILQKTQSLVPSLKPNPFSLTCQYNKIAISAHPNLKSSQKSTMKYFAFPSNLCIIIAHSMTPQPKKMILGKRENLRICQIRIGIQILREELGIGIQISSLEQLRKYLNCTTQQLLQTIQQSLPKQALSPQQIEQLSQKPLIEIVRQIPYSNNVIDENLQYKPYSRIKHYILQQLALQKLTTDNFIQTVNKSYKNCMELLEIGSEQIDEMVDIIKDLAQGWKIIGDAWGGYLAIFCQEPKSDVIIEKLVEDFYMSSKNQVLLSDDVEQYIRIVGKPGNGLALLDPSSEIWFC